MEINFGHLLLAALSSLVVGFIWFNPKVFGTIWAREANVSTDNKPKTSGMFKLLILSFLFALMMCIILQSIVIHQMGVFGLIGGDLTTAKPSYTAFMTDYSTTFRSFKHGAFHGVLTSIFFVFPLIAINGMYDNRSWKYIFVVSGYWLCCLAVMGGLICAMY